MNVEKACSGKCRSEGCAGVPRIWIVAACEGMVSLFSKEKDGLVTPRPWSACNVFPSMDRFQQSIEEAAHDHAFDQLIIVGSSSDIAWVHSSLPENAARYIAAEIKYPLLSSWFKEPTPLPHLTQALQTVLRH